MSLNRGSSPARASFMAAMVSSLGTRGAKGSAFIAGNAGKQNAHRIGDGEPHRREYRCGLFLDFAVDAGLDKMVRHVGRSVVVEVLHDIVMQHGCSFKMEVGTRAARHYLELSAGRRCAMSPEPDRRGLRTGHLTDLRFCLS